MAEYVRRLMVAARTILSSDEDLKEGGDLVNVGAWGVSGSLRPHQVEGVTWLIRRYQHGVNYILVILCPLSVTNGLMSEFATFPPNHKVMRYVGGKVLHCGLCKEMLEHVSKRRSEGDISFILVIQLGKACSHPYLFRGIEPEPFSVGEHFVLATGKLIVLDKLPRKLLAGNHRILLFAQMTETLDILQSLQGQDHNLMSNGNGISTCLRRAFATLKNSLEKSPSQTSNHVTACISSFQRS